jgi:hypothetical protein
MSPDYIPIPSRPTSNIEVAVYSRIARVLGCARYGIVATCLACGSSTDPSKEPQSITVTAAGGHTLAINLGTQIQLKVTAKNAAGEEITGVGPFSFTSRDPSIVTVDATGMLSAIHVGPTYVVVALVSGTRTLVDSLDVDVATAIQQR